MSAVPKKAFDLLDAPGIGRFLHLRHARALLQLPLFLIAVLMIWNGLAGPQVAPENLATTWTWLHYRGLVVLALMTAGNLFCMACPFMLARNLARRLHHPVRRWPRRLRNKWLTAALFALFLYAYEEFHLWDSPWWTAWLILGYFLAAVTVDSLFQGAPFCKYVCPLGQFNFVSSLISPLEVKVRDRRTCVTCETKDCIKGRGSLPGCELLLFQQRKVGNMDCTFCLDCVHACPHDNVGISLRLPGSELWADPSRSGIGRFSRRPDLATLVILFTFGALLNAFGMVSPIYAVEALLSRRLGVHGEAPLLGIVFFLGIVVEPALLLISAGWLARRWAGLRLSLLRTITRYAYALVPLGFGFWLAHYAFHFLTGFWSFIPVLQTLAVSMGWPVLGAPRWDLGPLLPVSWLFPLEIASIGLGGFGSLLAAYEMACRDAPQYPWKAFLPWAGLLSMLAATGVWLMNQPMEMRGTFMPR